ncbi:MAG TPA: hypothetical protein V6D33_11625 [Cyanophyceae cyanobacterium]
MSQPNQPQYPARNEFKMGRRDNVVNVEIAATSPEMAQKIYKMIEQGCIAIAKSELEFNWYKGN